LAQAEVENIRVQAAGRLVEGHDLTRQGPAHEFAMELPDKRLLVERIVLVPKPQGATAYILAVEGQGLRADSPEVPRFFDSLQIDPPPPAPAPNPNPNPTPKPGPNLNPRPGPNPGPSPRPDPNQLKLNGDQLTIHPGGTQRARYAPDGKTLAAVGEDGV